MTKWILFSFIFLFCFRSYAQTKNSDTAAVHSSSKNLLEKSISFRFQGGKLALALEQLSKEHGVKFSFSDNKIESEKVSAIEHKEAPLSVLLDTLLNPTTFTYMVVGTNVLIFEDKKKTASGNNSVSDSTFSDSTASVYKSHIYVPQSGEINLPPKLRKELARLYREELKLASKRNDKIKEKTDTTRIESYIPKEDVLSNYRYYISTTFGLNTNQIRLKSNTKLDWRKDLDYVNTVSNSFVPELGVGFVYKNWLLGSGFIYHHFRIKEDWTEETKKGPPKDRTKTFKNRSFNFQTFNIPVQIQYLKQWQKIFLGLGFGMEVGFINSSFTNQESFKSYFEKETKGEKYYENLNSSVVSAFINISAKFFIKEHLFLSSGLEFRKGLNPVIRNSLYNVTSQSWGFNVSFIYFK